jgi:hypothetical protein
MNDRVYYTWGEMETDRVSCTWGELRDGAATGPPAEEKPIF